LFFELDTEGKGYLTKDEAFHVIEQIYSLIDYTDFVIPGKLNMSPKRWDQVFNQIDTD